MGEGAAAKLAEFARHRCGPACLVLSDENTREVGGEAVLSALGGVGKRCVELTYPAAPFDATEERANETAGAGLGCDFYVAVGSGTLCDLAKSAGSAQQKPVLLYPTAASMNGYTSAIVALEVRGLKRTLACDPATGVFADPACAATAPQRMTAAGVADFLSKCSSSTDWAAAHLLRGGYYCRRPREFSEGIQEQLSDRAPEIGRGEVEAVGLVLEALLLSGFSMVIAGSSAPASGGEHLISHYLDMKHALYGTPNDLHGAQVGIGTIHTLDLWERVLELDPHGLDIEALVAAQPTQESICERIMNDWGPRVGEEVWGQWCEKTLDSAGLRAELKRFQQIFPELRSTVLQDLQPASVVADCIKSAGGPVRPKDMKAPLDEYRKALDNARYLRNRFTILDLAGELCVG